MSENKTEGKDKTGRNEVSSDELVYHRKEATSDETPD